MENIILVVDGNECTLRQFIHANTEQDGQIAFEELLLVISLKPGEDIYVGIVNVKRIK